MTLDQVYVGHWIDWSYGTILGSRVTVPYADGRYLIAFIATFDAWVGGATWSLFAYLHHQYRLRNIDRDEVFDQVQISYRNSSTPFAFMTNIISIVWGTRKRSRQSCSRVMMLTIMPLFLSLLFAVAGTLSSRIASNADVLLKGGVCGFLGASNSSLDTVDTGLVVNYLDGVLMKLSNDYSQQCYTNPLSNSSIQSTYSDASRLSCKGYTKPSLPFKYNLHSKCPFENACAHGDILELDTGLLDSNTDFGVNQPLENRIGFRKLSTCAPLSTSGFSDNAFNQIDGFGNISVYAYGWNIYQPTKFAYTSELPYDNVTFVYSEDAYLAAQSAYYLMTASTVVNYSAGATFKPLAELSPDPTRAFTLVFLANRAFYNDAINDTWFNATSPVIELAAVNGNGTVETTFYLSGNPGSVLACTEQVQICNPVATTVDTCTDLDSWYRWGGFLKYYHGEADMTKLTAIGLNDVQQTTAMVLLDAAYSGSVQNVVGQLGTDSLLASNYITRQETYWSPTLATNQWQIEAANWFAIGLAQTQRAFIANYRPSSEQILKDYWETFPAIATSEQVLCSNQKVQSLEYTTFSTLGLGLNFGIGGLLLLAGYLLPVLLPWLQNRRAKAKGRHAHARDRWEADHALDMQRKLSKLSASSLSEEMTVLERPNPDTLKVPLLRLASGRSSIF